MRRARGCASRALLILTRNGKPITTCRFFVLLNKSAGDSLRAPAEPSQKKFFFAFFFQKNCIYQKIDVPLQQILKTKNRSTYL